MRKTRSVWTLGIQGNEPRLTPTIIVTLYRFLSSKAGVSDSKVLVEDDEIELAAHALADLRFFLLDL